MKKTNVKKNILKIVILCLIFMCSILCTNIVLAKNEKLNSKIEIMDYTEEYHKWLELSDEEKSKVLEPRKFDVIYDRKNIEYIKQLNNPLRASSLLGATLENSYDLRDIISENLVIKNQMQTNTCWAFACIGTLESHFALKDNIANNPLDVYDFSERHMTYSSLRSVFENNEINEYGKEFEIDDGGTILMAQAYLTNGMGPINETDMPFENTSEDIDILEIQNKEIQTTVLDTIFFESTSVTDEEGVLELK